MQKLRMFYDMHLSLGLFSSWVVHIIAVREIDDFLFRITKNQTLPYKSG